MMFGLKQNHVPEFRRRHIVMMLPEAAWSYKSGKYQYHFVDQFIKDGNIRKFFEGLELFTTDFGIDFEQVSESIKKEAKKNSGDILYIPDETQKEVDNFTKGLREIDHQALETEVKITRFKAEFAAVMAAHGHLKKIEGAKEEWPVNLYESLRKYAALNDHEIRMRFPENGGGGSVSDRARFKGFKGWLEGLRKPPYTKKILDISAREITLTSWNARVLKLSWTERCIVCRVRHVDIEMDEKKTNKLCATIHIRNGSAPKNPFAKDELPNRIADLLVCAEKIKSHEPVPEWLTGTSWILKLLKYTKLMPSEFNASLKEVPDTINGSWGMGVWGQFYTHENKINARGIEKLWCTGEPPLKRFTGKCKTSDFLKNVEELKS
ncbi:hypothetical protein HQ545_01830 [Candidatus Woesearchaeota archaeon]|nr:hypothetical protein [Candidatus Woesearchaeota archaeon]